MALDAIFAPPARKAAPLHHLNITLEKLRVFWRLICDRGWISGQQLQFVTGRIDEIGRMVGGWLKDIERRTAR